MSPPAERPRLIVIGGGISGLAAAHRAWERAGDRVEVRVLEAAERPGGVIQTERHGELLIEGGPDSMVTDKRAAVELCRRLGLEDELQPTQEQLRRTLIVRDGRLHPVPDALHLMAPARLGPFLRSPILSWRGRLAALKDLVLPRGGPPPGEDESLAAFVRRRLGREVLERIAQPMIGGIYTADPERLSLAATMPRFLEMERDDRSLILGLRARLRSAPQEEATGPRYGLFVSLRDGMGALVERLIERLPAGAVQTSRPAARLERSPAGESRRWRVVLEGGEVEEADAVVVAVPAPRAARLLERLDPDLASALAGIEYASAAIVSLAYRKSDAPAPPEAFGFVVPHVEGRDVLAGSFSSVKYEGRAPPDQLLLRFFVGGALQADRLRHDDPSLVALVRREARELLGIRAEPRLTRVHRWPGSMPQYHVGHGRRVEEIEKRAAAHPTLALAGNAYHGVGLADCVRVGEEASQRLIPELLGRRETVSIQPA